MTIHWLENITYICGKKPINLSGSFMEPIVHIEKYGWKNDDFIEVKGLVSG